MSLLDIVTCISLDVDHSHLISGSADLICAVWKIEMSNGLCSGLSKKPIQTLFGHDSCITAVAMSSDLDLAVSGSKVSMFNPVTIELKKIISNLIQIAT